jgi:hypothetical protein
VLAGLRSQNNFADRALRTVGLGLGTSTSGSADCLAFTSTTPTGSASEFACQPEDGEAPAVIPGVTQTKAETHDELVTLPGAPARDRDGSKADLVAVGHACPMTRNVSAGSSPSG